MTRPPFPPAPKLTTISIGYVADEVAARIFADEIHKRPSYMDFQVRLCPAGGSINVLVVTTYDAPRKEIEEMLMYIMFCAIANPKGAK